MSASSPPTDSPVWRLEFLTDQWVWEEDFQADDVDAAKARAREALVTLVREESPELACVTLIRKGAKIGVWDWVEGQPYWSPL